ncbi:hypothetical protein B0T10DRAFT_81293 [Thelonectria olida]|uniref:Secreted protein n=1 Tax=Thelonectria olida TaxID=1576542 RepID=A0A9P9AMK4_9HYPO|nr:hypothetical protein B0T10DRAFT_81293 [Thelonectria olida]
MYLAHCGSHYILSVKFLLLLLSSSSTGLPVSPQLPTSSLPSTNVNTVFRERGAANKIKWAQALASDPQTHPGCFGILS